MNNEQVAILLWERFSPEHEITWPSAHASEYRLAASDVIEKLVQRSHGAALVPKEAPEDVARKIAIDIARGCSAERIWRNAVALAAAFPPVPTITDEAVERAAKAIAEAWGETWACSCAEQRGLDCDCGDAMCEDREGRPYDEDLTREDCRMAARAALLAAFPSRGEAE